MEMGIREHRDRRRPAVLVAFAMALAISPQQQTVVRSTWPPGFLSTTWYEFVEKTARGPEGGGKNGRESVERLAMDDGSLDKHGMYQDPHLRSGGQRASIAGDGGPSMDGLRRMMYGFGDDESPLPETAACMQQLVSEYVRHITDEACKAAEAKGKLDTECFVFAVRGDKAKFKRVKELLDLNVHIKNTTRQKFTDQDMPVFYPSFLPPPKVRSVVSIPSLGAVYATPPSPSPPESPPSSSSSSPPQGDEKR
eukprot:jgi/Undpi1/5492/HiC_scaffold_2.g00771.m1